MYQLYGIENLQFFHYISKVFWSETFFLRVEQKILLDMKQEILLFN